MPILAGIGSAVAGAVTNSVLNQSNEPTTDAPPIESALVGPDPSETKENAEVKVSGAQADDYIKQTMDAAFTKGIGSVMNPSKSAAELGRDQRSFMDNAYSDLNQWEQAGASAAGAAVDNQAQNNAKEMQSAQLKSNEKIATINAQSNQDIATQNNQTSLATNKHSMGPAYEMLNDQMDKLKQDILIGRVSEKEGIARISKLQQETKNLSESQSQVGKTVSDAKAGVKTAWDAKPFGEDHWIHKPVRELWNSFKSGISGGDSTSKQRARFRQRKQNK